jgi:hypothetical protein
LPSEAPALRKEQFTFLEEVERDFDGLPPEIQQSFLSHFPEFGGTPGGLPPAWTLRRFEICPDVGVSKLKEAMEGCIDRFKVGQTSRCSKRGKRSTSGSADI